MDAITRFALSVNNEAVRVAGLFLGDPFIYAAVLVVLLFLGERRGEKRNKVILSLIITLLMAVTVKYAMARERPCTTEGWCPDDYSFPSIHAALAFTLMTAFVNKRSYVFYMFFALFVSFTRLNLGVHIFQDAAAALPIALVSYYITDILWKTRKGGDETVPEERGAHGKRG